MFSEIKKEIKQLREICREKEVVDVVLLRCSEKEKTSKIDLTIVFKDKKTNYNNKIFLKIKKIFNKNQA